MLGNHYIEGGSDCLAARFVKRRPVDIAVETIPRVCEGLVDSGIPLPTVMDRAKGVCSRPQQVETAGQSQRPRSGTCLSCLLLFNLGNRLEVGKTRNVWGVRRQQRS